MSAREHSPVRPVTPGFEHLDGVFLAPTEDSFGNLDDESFAFHSCLLRAVQLAEATSENSDVGQPDDSDALSRKLNIACNLRLVNDHLVELRVYVSGTVGAELPLHIRTIHSAFFRSGKSVSKRRLLEAVNGGGMRWVYPYIREFVSSLTQRTPYGAVMLDMLTDTPQLVPAEEIDRLAPL